MRPLSRIFSVWRVPPLERTGDRRHPLAQALAPDPAAGADQQGEEDRRRAGLIVQQRLSDRNSVSSGSSRQAACRRHLESTTTRTSRTSGSRSGSTAVEVHDPDQESDEPSSAGPSSAGQPENGSPSLQRPDAGLQRCDSPPGRGLPPVNLVTAWPPGLGSFPTSRAMIIRRGDRVCRLDV